MASIAQIKGYFAQLDEIEGDHKAISASIEVAGDASVPVDFPLSDRTVRVNLPLSAALPLLDAQAAAVYAVLEGIGITRD